MHRIVLALLPENFQVLETRGNLTPADAYFDVGNQYWQNEKRSRNRLSRNVICAIDGTPRNISIKLRRRPPESNQKLFGVPGIIYLGVLYLW